jgi:S-layer homology domain
VKIKSHISALLIVGFLFVGLPTAFADGSFPDVPSTSPYYTAIEYFRNLEVIQGYNDGTFRPNQEANRAEALKIIILSSSIDVTGYETGANVFPDVIAADWFYPYIKKAKELEIIEGYEDGYFRPVQIQNIAETLKMILVTNNIAPPTLESNTLVFPDVPENLWYASYAYYAKEKNIIEPQDDGTMNAGRAITRGELIEIMYRMAIVKQNGGAPFDISTNWPEELHANYAFKTKRPFDWKIVNNEDEVVFWRQDTANHQSSYEVSFPFGASMTFHLDQNEKGLSQTWYMENLEYVYKSDFGSFQRNTLNLGGYPALNLNVSLDHDDYFVFLPENRVLHIYTSYGWSDLSDHLMDEIDGVLRNLEYVPYQAASSPDILSTVRDRILVESVGQQTMDLFDDLVNIETDTIGVGTGPIDYFYSAEYDITLKYERASDTILDMQNSQTSAF